MYLDAYPSRVKLLIKSPILMHARVILVCLLHHFLVKHDLGPPSTRFSFYYLCHSITKAKYTSLYRIQQMSNPYRLIHWWREGQHDCDKWKCYEDPQYWCGLLLHGC